MSSAALPDRAEQVSPHPPPRPLMGAGGDEPDRVPRDPQLPRDMHLRHAIREMQPPNQRPVFHRDHPSNRVSGAQFLTSDTAQFLTSADIDGADVAR